MSNLELKVKHEHGRLWQWCLSLGIAVATLLFLSLRVEQQNTEIVRFSIFLFNNGNILGNAIILLSVFGAVNALKKILFLPIGFIKCFCLFALSALFSLFSVLSLYFETDFSGGLRVALSSVKSLASFLGALCGGIVFFFLIIRLLWYFLEHRIAVGLPENNRVISFFGDHVYRNCILLIALCWLPQYIIRFPGVVPYDVWQSIAMHLGYTEITTQHPLIWGALVGFLTQLGEMIGIKWLAPLIVCFVQHILSVLLVAYLIVTLKRFNVNTWVLAATLAFFILLPPMSLYASTLYNDCFYYLSIMLLTIELVYYLYDRETFFSQCKHPILTAISVFGTIFRYNGLYTMLAVLAVIALREVFFCIKRKGRVRQALALVIACLFVPILLGQVVQNSLNSAFGAREIRSRAMLAMPIQQSVRCLIVHGETMDKADYEAIHAVLTWSDDEYEKRYNPRNFDGVKESFKNNATKEEMTAFLKAWGHLVVQYPQTCFMATAHQTYYLFSPLVDNVRYYESISAHTDLALQRYGFHADSYALHSPFLATLCRYLHTFETLIFARIPLLGLIVNPAAYTILLAAACLAGIFRKDKRVLILTIALLVTLAITFLGPAVYNHPRYIYPIMFCMPILLVSFKFPKKSNGVE